jgi:hypothetical protein
MGDKTWTLKYYSETLLPAIVENSFDQIEKELCALSLEPDKTVLLVGELRRSITTWLAYHVTAEAYKKAEGR